MDVITTCMWGSKCNNPSGILTNTLESVILLSRALKTMSICHGELDTPAAGASQQLKNANTLKNYAWELHYDQQRIAPSVWMAIVK